MFNTKPSYYVPTWGDHKGQKGVMVGRFADPSYDDIQLKFEDGECRWYKYSDVRHVETETKPI